MSEFKLSNGLKISIPRRLVVIFLLFSVIIILMGIYYYKVQRNRDFKEQEKNLTAIATLKIREIINWHNERIGDASTIKDNQPLIKEINQFFRDTKEPEIRRDITEWIESVNKYHDYSSVLLVDTLLKVRLYVTPTDTVAGDAITSELHDVIRKNTIVMTDLHRANCVSYVHLDIIIPLTISSQHKNKPFGLLILRIDPEKILFPLIKAWPTPSKSSETLLLRREGDSIVYLNDLRHQNNTAVKLKMPLSRSNLLAAIAAEGNEGVYEGIDYRNNPVVGYLGRIPDLPWYMVAKVDKKEIEEPLKNQVYIAILGTILLILINASIFGFWIWDQQVRLYRKQLKIEAEVRESEKLYRAIGESINFGVWVCDSEGRNIYASDSFLKMVGITQEQCSNFGWGSLLHPDDSERTISKWIECVRTGGDWNMEHRFHGIDGKWHYVLARGVPVRDTEGRITKWAGINLDISDLKLAENALRESEEKFKYIFTHSVIGKSITLPSGEINVNKAFCDLLGYSMEELEQAKWKDISHPDDYELTQKMINSLISAEKDSTRFIKRYLHKNGAVVWADVGTTIRRDDDGNPLYFMTTINDITDKKKAEEALLELNEKLEARVIQRTEQLETANKELEAFSYSVSHDLRAPLRAVHSFTNILLEEYENQMDDEGKRLCGIISSSAIQMGGLIDDLLSFSRIGRSTLNPAVLEMKSVAKSGFNDATTTTNDSQKNKTKLIIGRLHKVRGDPGLIKLVWNNLLSNAIKYSSKTKNPEITIGSIQENGSIVYFVKDNGVGFDMQYKHKLFGVFQRLHSESEFEGNGVGLAIVKRIIQKHDGKVWAESEVGKGATFYFSLPAISTEEKF
jgi:PAS domain S-box-containing protein